MNERTVVTSAAAFAAVGLLSLLLAYRYEPSGAQSDVVPAVSTTAAVAPTIVQQCQQATYLAYFPLNVTVEAPALDPASDELCVPISALRPDATIVGAFLSEEDACNYRNQHPGTSVRGLQAATETDPCR